MYRTSVYSSFYFVAYRIVIIYRITYRIYSFTTGRNATPVTRTKIVEPNLEELKESLSDRSMEPNLEAEF